MVALVLPLRFLVPQVASMYAAHIFKSVPPGQSPHELERLGVCVVLWIRKGEIKCALAKKKNFRLKKAGGVFTHLVVTCPRVNPASKGP